MCCTLAKFLGWHFGQEVLPTSQSIVNLCSSMLPLSEICVMMSKLKRLPIPFSPHPCFLWWFCGRACSPHIWVFMCHLCVRLSFASPLPALGTAWLGHTTFVCVPVFDIFDDICSRQCGSGCCWLQGFATFCGKSALDHETQDALASCYVAIRSNGWHTVFYMLNKLILRF